MTAEPSPIAVLRRRLSPARFDRYVAAADGSLSEGLRLYEWNVAAAGAFSESLGQFEVLLRNAMDEQLRRYCRKVLRSDERWYAVRAMPLQTYLWSHLESARDRATRQKSLPEVHGKVVAELNFGFWRYVLDARHQATLWGPALRHAFPHQRPRKRIMVFDAVDALYRLRNRVAHSEPVHGLPLAARWQQLLDVTSYIEPAAASWLSSISRVPHVLAARPALPYQANVAGPSGP